MQSLTHNTQRTGFVALVAMVLLFGFQVGLLHHASSHHHCHVDGKPSSESSCSLCQTASHYALVTPTTPELVTFDLVSQLDLADPALFISLDRGARRARSPPLADFS